MKLKMLKMVAIDAKATSKPRIKAHHSLASFGFFLKKPCETTISICEMKREYCTELLDHIRLFAFGLQV